MAKEDVIMARDTLKRLLKPNDLIYCSIGHVAKSGMSRTIKFLIAAREPKGKPYIRDITGLIAKACGHSLREDGLFIEGGGMDMGFHVVYDLGLTLWPKGTRRPHGTRNGQLDHEGGYALKHTWL